jgi:SAM-dependent methyltransferase
VPVLLIGEATSRPTPTDAEFERLLGEAAGAPFHGWDMSWLHNRQTITVEGSADPIEQYDTRATMLVAQAGAVLDIGTGDGRRFARYAPFPAVAVAAEGFAPNVPLATHRLEPLGVQVIWTDENCHNSRGPQPGNRWPQRRLPFADDTFDLVLAHRAAFAPREIARVLRSGGRLLTLQGITEWRGETLADALTGTPPEWTLPGFGWDVGDSLRQSGLNILEWTESSVAVTYHDIGAIVYELLHVPWSVVDFDLDRFRERLFRLHRRMLAESGFRTRVYSNLIEAQKP